jgi:hypothetical protein
MCGAGSSNGAGIFSVGELPDRCLSLSLFPPSFLYFFFPGKIHLEQESGILFDLPSRPFPTRKKKKELFKFFTILYMCVLSDPHRQKKTLLLFYKRSKNRHLTTFLSLCVDEFVSKENDKPLSFSFLLFDRDN